MDKYSLSPPSGLTQHGLPATSAWATPVGAVSAAAPTSVASTSNQGLGRLAAVRTTAHDQPTNLQPGFRFGYPGAATSVAATVTLKSTSNVSSFGQVFHAVSPSINWSFAKSGPVNGVYTYTAIATFKTGPSTYTNSNHVPGNTHGITIVGLPGTYTAVVTPSGASAHPNAAFTYA